MVRVGVVQSLRNTEALALLLQAVAVFVVEAPTGEAPFPPRNGNAELLYGDEARIRTELGGVAVLVVRPDESVSAVLERAVRLPDPHLFIVLPEPHRDADLFARLLVRLREDRVVELADVVPVEYEITPAGVIAAVLPRGPHARKPSRGSRRRS